jgi:hypothetical protein
MTSFYRALRELLLLVLLVGCPAAGGKGEQSDFERYRRRIAPPSGERILPAFETESSREPALTAEFWWPEAGKIDPTYSRAGPDSATRPSAPAP